MNVALVQFRVEQSAHSSNLARAMRAIDEAANADPAPDVICLPECCDLGWLAAKASEFAEPGGGTFTESMGLKAREHGVFVVAGVTERDGDRLYNSAVMLDPDGDPILRHRKINIMGVAKDCYAVGDRLQVRDTILGRLALTVCADSWVPHLTQSLAAMGAAAIFSPCAWVCKKGDEAANLEKIEAWYKARTKECDVYLFGANAVGDVTEGPWKGRILHGNSLAYGPGGKRLARGPTNDEAIVRVEIDMET